MMASTTHASIGQFAGGLKKVDSNTRGITILNIVPRGTRVIVHAWGSCHPRDCDWGTERSVAYAPNVSADLRQAANALTVTFRTNFGMVSNFRMYEPQSE